MTVTIKLRRGLASEWLSIDPVLKNGEPGFEYDTGKLKIGDGSSVWTELAYVSASGAGGGSSAWGDLTGIPANLTNIGGLTTASGDVIVASGNHVFYVTNLAESIDDRTAQLLVAGTGMSLSYNDSGNALTVSNISSPRIVTTVFNSTGSQIPKFKAVYINGGQGDQPTIQLAIASNEVGSSKTYGITASNIDNMGTGEVVVLGSLTGINTDQFNPTAPTGNVNGANLWLSPSVSGGITVTKPSAPDHVVYLGSIVRTHQNEGVVEVRIQNGYELGELHNVALNGTTNGQFLQYNSASGLWLASSSGNFSTLLVNGTGVSVTGHSHTSSNITDFNSSVSGLLPITSIVGNSGIVVSNAGAAYTVSQSGLIKSDITGITGASGIVNIVQISETDYNALGSKDPFTLYILY